MSVDAGTATGQSAARQRVETALLALGPGLADVALRCCCHLEGLEPAERRMGWFGLVGQECSAHRIATPQPPLQTGLP